MGRAVARTGVRGSPIAVRAGSASRVSTRPSPVIGTRRAPLGGCALAAMRRLRTTSPAIVAVIPTASAAAGRAIALLRGNRHGDHPTPGTTKGPVRGPSSTSLGGDLLSHPVSRAVPSALEGLTSGFGMGPGVSPPPWPPKRCLLASPELLGPQGILRGCEPESRAGEPRNSIASASKGQVLGLLVPVG